MDLQKQGVLEAALREQRERRDASRVRRRKRKTKERPWRVLKEDWFRFMRARYGRVIQLSPWAAKEEKLARKLLAEVELETASRMVELFIDGWDRDGLPSFGYFWTARDSYRAMAEGKIGLKRNDLNEDEYSEKRDGTAPLIGW